MKSKTDLLCATDPGQISVLNILDLSLAFDTVYHSIHMRHPGETSERTDMVQHGGGFIYCIPGSIFLLPAFIPKGVLL